MLTYPAVLRPEIGLQRVSLYEGGQDFIQCLANIQGIFGNAYEVFYANVVENKVWTGNCGGVLYTYSNQRFDLGRVSIRQPGLVINPNNVFCYYIPEKIDASGPLLYMIPNLDSYYPSCRLLRVRTDDSFMQHDLLCLDTMGTPVADELIGPMVQEMNNDANRVREVLLGTN